MRFALLFALVFLGACRVAPKDDQLVATLPTSANDWWVDISEDGTLAAYADRQGRKVLLIVGDRTYGPFT